jgi:NitT/TauT family transport system substrate-binding protein
MKKHTLLLTALMTTALFAACAPAPTPAPTAAPPTAAPVTTTAPATSAPTASPTAAPTTAALVKITSAWSQANTDASPLWVAYEQGFFKQNGLDVTLTFINGGTQHAQALVSKDVAIGITSAAPVVSATAGGADLELVAGLVNRINYDFIVQPSIKTAADLKGKKVAVSGASGSSATAMRLALKLLFSLDPDKDVATLSIGNEVEREAALASKQIDASVLGPDTTPQAKKDGLVLFDSLWARDIQYQHTGVGTTKSFAKANPQVVTNYLKSIIQAIGYMKDPANKANVIQIMSKYLKINDQEVLGSAYIRMTQTILQCAPYVTMDGMKTVIGETQTAVDKGLTPDQAADNSFLKQLDDSGFVKANCK